MSNIKILTYNILSSELAILMRKETKDGKLLYDKPFMDNEYRWAKLKDYLNEQISKSNNDLIICLQEVSEDWLSRLAELFAHNQYKYINVQHGRIFNGNMGVLIAYPIKYSITKSEFFYVGKHIIVSNENSKISASKTNVAIMIILENPTINFKIGVCTYHMPCEPTKPQVALTHAKVLYKKLIKFMESTEFIYAGDFNMTPDSYAYSYLKNNLNCVWKDYLSFYPITNHAYILGNEFSGCIDYIFYTKKLKCINVKYDEINNIIPDIKQPSDHTPIIATLNV